MKTAAINLRAMPEQRDLIDHAAALLGKNRSDFMLEVACEQARSIVLDQTFFALESGVFQDSCRKNHAAFLKFFCVGLSGLSVTSATGVQFRVLPDQRVGCLSLAAA